jgi:hypothetical protein
VGRRRASLQFRDSPGKTPTQLSVGVPSPGDENLLILKVLA